MPELWLWSAPVRPDCERRKWRWPRQLRVVLCDAQPSAGRKFLVAGRGGLNLTHSEPVENFPNRYRAEPERWRDLLS